MKSFFEIKTPDTGSPGKPFPKRPAGKKAVRWVAAALLLSASATVLAQDTVRYTGSTLVNVDYHHGQLSPVVGVHNVQVFRANREHPEWAGGMNWTYNHAPMLAYWNGTFYLHFLSNPVGEHVPPGQTSLLTSKDGYTWSKPAVIFPPLKIPDGYVKEGRPEVAKDLYAVSHQRMGFYVSKSNRLLTLAYYGVGSSRVDLQACKLEYSIVSPK